MADSIPTLGQIVRIRTRSYLVEDVELTPGYGSVIKLACVDDDAQGDSLEVIWELELDTEIVDESIWKNIGKKGFDNSKYFASYIHTIRWNCVTATDPKLFQAPFRAGIKIEAYQLEPLAKALQLPRVNLFIADDVGLGKTIEAGLIATELLLRRRVKEIVVSCPPTMLEQWKDELESRFGLTFEILDRKYIERIRQERGYGVNPWTTFPRFLISQRLLIDELYVGPLRDWLDNIRPGTLFIFDEAHHAAPASGARYAIDSKITKAVRDIAFRFEHKLFLSATPHNGHSNSFSALLEILDRNRFTRGVKVRKSDLEKVMVRRLKDDIREIAGGFPKRNPIQITIKDLPEDAPELQLSVLLNEYRKVRQQRLVDASKRKQVEGALLISGLQQRLLSSIEAFARTLRVHRRTMEKIWAGEIKEVEEIATPIDRQLLVGAIESDDDRSLLSEEEQATLENETVESATASTAGTTSSANITHEKELLTKMEEVAEIGRGQADARTISLLKWMKEKMCQGIKIPNELNNSQSPEWNDIRIIIFTEYEDTRRYLVEILRLAIKETHLADNRIEVFHGPTPSDKRAAIKRAFNLPPSEHPVRILVATDAAREGLNLQAHCWNLFHFDLPWNPSRLEQRNGRIDRKLQPAPEVNCHYFFYQQRLEDKILQTLVRKTDIIRKELGSLSMVLEERLADDLRLGIQHEDVAKLQKTIEDAGLEKSKQEAVTEELEASRKRQKDLQEEIDRLRGRINDAKKWIGFENDSLRDALSCSLEIMGAEPLKITDGSNQFVFPNLEVRYGSDPAWFNTLDVLRKPPEDGKHSYQWRKDSPIRPVVFNPPDGIDDSIVQLHLQHRVTQRLLGRFISQGFVYDDLSRACLTQSNDAIPRVILLGRISLYGKGAVRLHEEVLSVTARWIDPVNRKSKLSPYGRDSEIKTLDLLEESFKSTGNVKLSNTVQEKLLATVANDIEDLLPHLYTRGEESKADAEKKLQERGKIESKGMLVTLEDQKKRVAAEYGKAIPDQLELSFNEEEKRQLESNKKYWQRWLENVEDDIKREPDRIMEFYNVTSYRIEPIGIAYLWPVTG